MRDLSKKCMNMKKTFNSQTRKSKPLTKKEKNGTRSRTLIRLQPKNKQAMSIGKQFLLFQFLCFQELLQQSDALGSFFK